MNAAIGFRVHSGWAAMVAVAGSPSEPVILDRRRMEIAHPSIRGSVQPYHRSKELGIEKAPAFLRECGEASLKMAKTALRQAIRELKDHDILACGLLLSSGRAGGELESILASHAAIHTAEGDFFREAINHAVASCKLPCRKIKEKQLLEIAQTTFGIDMTAHLNELRKTVGAPWTQDEKFAAIAAWLALAH